MFVIYPSLHPDVSTSSVSALSKALESKRFTRPPRTWNGGRDKLRCLELCTSASEFL